jgi:carotenoid cleavage dioxygenase-like enzyme
MTGFTHNLFRGSGEGHWQLEIEGHWPDDVDGRIFIVGPDHREPGAHWFAAQGLLLRASCQPNEAGRLEVETRRIRTPLDGLREALPGWFRTNGVQEVSPFGFTNFANTNVQPIADRLFVGYDVGRPIEVDPETLEYLTPVGRNAEWLQTLPAAVEPMIAVAAHPAPDFEEGALYFANYKLIPLNGAELRLCRWGLEGDVEHWPLEGVPHFDSIHDVKCTRDHVIIMDLPFVSDPVGPVPGQERRRVQDFARLFIVAKAALQSTPIGSAVPYRMLELPMMGGHIAVDRAQSGSEITVYLSHHPITDLGSCIEADDRIHGSGAPFPEDLVGLPPIAQQPVAIGRYRIDADSGKVLEQSLASNVEAFWGGALFSQDLYSGAARDRQRALWMSSIGFDPQLVSERWWRSYSEVHENVLVAPRDLPRQSVPGALARIDLEEMTFADLYTYPAGSFAHPATFVPRRGRRDGGGYVIVMVHRDGDKSLEIFDAQDLSRGPLASASAKGFGPALMLHSCWMPERRGPRPSSYRVDEDTDAWQTLAQLGAAPEPAIAIGQAIYGAARRDD